MQLVVTTGLLSKLGREKFLKLLLRLNDQLKGTAVVWLSQLLELSAPIIDQFLSFSLHFAENVIHFVEAEIYLLL